MGFPAEGLVSNSESPGSRQSCESRSQNVSVIGSPGGGLSNHGHGIHGNAGRMMSHDAKKKGLATQATAGMGDKMAKKWDLKLTNRTQNKEVRRMAALEIQERLEVLTLLSGAAVTGRNKGKHQMKNKKSKFECRRSSLECYTGQHMKACFQCKRQRRQGLPTPYQCGQRA